MMLFVTKIQQNHPIEMGVCSICLKRFPHKVKGRLRQTCSDRCRQIRKRRGDDDDAYDRWADSCREDRHRRAAERELKRIERRVGSLAIPEGAYLTLRDRLKIRLLRGEKLPFCAVCGMPYVQDTWRKHPVCSAKCRRQFLEHGRATIDAMYYWRKLYDRSLEADWAAGRWVPLCAHCGKPFRSENRRRKYCSEKCKDAAYWVRRPLKRCPGCGEQYRGHAATCSRRCEKNLYRRTERFCVRCEHAIKPGCEVLPNKDTVLPPRRRTFRGEPTIRSQREIMFCSGRCRDARGWSPLRKVCEECGTAYYPHTQSQAPRQKYCSKQCTDRAFERARKRRRQLDHQPITTCQHCGETFERAYQGGQPPRYCSARCKGAAKRARRRDRREAPIAVEIPVGIPLEVFERDRVMVAGD